MRFPRTDVLGYFQPSLSGLRSEEVTLDDASQWLSESPNCLQMQGNSVTKPLETTQDWAGFERITFAKPYDIDATRTHQTS
jgi:hypothetical protein